MLCPALIDERTFPSYASTIKMTEEKKKERHNTYLDFVLCFHNM